MNFQTIVAVIFTLLACHQLESGSCAEIDVYEGKRCGSGYDCDSPTTGMTCATKENEFGGPSNEGSTCSCGYFKTEDSAPDFTYPKLDKSVRKCVVKLGDRCIVNGIYPCEPKSICVATRNTTHPKVPGLCEVDPNGASRSLRGNSMVVYVLGIFITFLWATKM